MPADPFKRACLIAGCGAPVHYRGRCLKHGRQVDALRSIGADRQAGAALYASPAWRRTREGFLSLHPWCECEVCQVSRRYHKATVVHHVRPHGGDGRLFFDVANLQALAKPCHDRMTAGQRADLKRSDLAGGMPVEKLKRPSAGIPRGRVARVALGSTKGVEG